MPIVGLVLTLAEEPQLAHEALDWLARDPRFTLGERAQRRVPVVLDTPDREADEVAWAELAALLGVVRADVIFAGIADEGPQQNSPDPW